MSRTRRLALIGALVIPVVAGGFVWQVRERQQGAQLLQEVLGLVNDRYVDTLPLSDVYEKAARGLVKELNDPYSELFTPRDPQVVQQLHRRTLRDSACSSSRIRRASHPHCDRLSEHAR